MGLVSKLSFHWQTFKMQSYIVYIVYFVSILILVSVYLVKT